MPWPKAIEAAANNAYVTGSAISYNFPTTPGAFQTIFGGGSGFQNGDAFVSKLNYTGTALIYSTYLGGSGGEFGNSIYVDASGQAYVAGNTRSPNFDTTPSAFQTTYGGPVSSFGSGDAFVTKLNNSGTALSYSTYLGGAGGDDGRGIAVNLAGEAYVVGSASSLNFPTTGGTVRVINGGAAKTTDGGASWAAARFGRQCLHHGRDQVEKFSRNYRLADWLSPGLQLRRFRLKAEPFGFLACVFQFTGRVQH